MGANAALGDWENIISAHINGAPYPMMMDAVRDAAIEFCRDTRIDRRLVLALPVLAATPDTLIPDGEDGEFPGDVVSVWTSEVEIGPLTRVDLAGIYPKGWMNQTVGKVRDVDGFISLRPGSIRLAARPEADTTIDLMVAYQPKRNADAVPQFLYEMYAYEIGWGALAILHAHDHASYANPQRAGEYRREFNAYKTTAADKGESGFQKPRRRTRRDPSFPR